MPSKPKRLTASEIRHMIRVAAQTRELAFAHRSLHKIGASVLTEKGEIFGGCNIESVISGLGTCAERCAIDHAIAHGRYNFRAICTFDEGFTPTCGACLQYVLLFSQLADEEIFMVNADVHGHFEVLPLSELLPHGYRTKHHLELIRSYGRGTCGKHQRTTKRRRGAKRKNRR